MGSGLHEEVYPEQLHDNVQDSDNQNSGEGAASALATMKKQFKQQRRDSGVAHEDNTLGGPS